jgi:hypothetical protein
MHHGALDMNLVKAYPAYEAELKKNNIPREIHIWPNSLQRKRSITEKARSQ